MMIKRNLMYYELSSFAPAVANAAATKLIAFEEKLKLCQK